MSKGSLIIISGPPGAGKSTLAEKIAKSRYKSINIEGDTIYNMVVGGKKEPWNDTEDYLLKLMCLSMAKIAHIYINDGFDVIVNYVFEVKELKYFINFLPSDLKTRILLNFILPDFDTLSFQNLNRNNVVDNDLVENYYNRFKKLSRSNALKQCFIFEDGVEFHLSELKETINKRNHSAAFYI